MSKPQLMKFRVEVQQAEIHTGYIEVDAESDEDAEQYADSLIGEGEKNKDDVVWKDQTTFGDLIVGQAIFTDE